MNAKSPSELNVTSSAGNTRRCFQRFVRRIRVFFDTSIEEETPVYAVDVSKPPIFPPCRIIRETGFPFIGMGEKETDLSVRTTAAWRAYIEEYGRALNPPNADLSGQPPKT